ncbi:Small ribosomal subunit biogenesis GTPase RsgA [bioreactor metagenome]|uniref:Small ribosomal subunit biogenesis GTPase RsgA n=1 Tax=bioreactor metagenome TaxID=1076179 RepID=A0A645BN78_9ZZZZ
MSLNNDFNLRRLERYLSIAWDSAATPVIVLTKSDLCNDLSSKLSEVYSVAIGVDVLVTTSTNSGGYAEMNKYLSSGITVAFVGSSGVGKSTLINRIIGNDLLATSEISMNDKGRHTTTHRQLISVPTGGLVIDTPGMRELQLETADLTKSFADIEELAKHCRFSDCAHQSEPGCAVSNAVRNGELSPERLHSYFKLQNELSYQGMNSRQLEQEKMQRLFAEVGGMKQARDFIKLKNKRK